ncbi:MAG: hypothetical protein ISR52_00645 [Rhodospirillales bacterium]|nr:hypothetical protein [Rhodospirillales bacterium]
MSEETLSVLYRPMWEEDRETLDCFRCVPKLANGSDDSNKGPDLLRSQEDAPNTTIARNLFVLNQAAKAVTDSVHRGEPVRMIIPISSFCLLNHEIATELVRIFKETPEEIRARMIFEIFDFPQRLTVDALDDITIPILPFFDERIARPAPQITDFTIFANINYTGVGIDLRDQKWPLEKIEPILKTFCGAAQHSRLKAYAQGVSNHAIGKLAVNCGIAGVDGDFMVRDTEEPKPVVNTETLN